MADYDAHPEYWSSLPTPQETAFTNNYGSTPTTRRGYMFDDTIVPFYADFSQPRDRLLSQISKETRAVTGGNIVRQLGQKRAAPAHHETIDTAAAGLAAVIDKGLVDVGNQLVQVLPENIKNRAVASLLDLGMGIGHIQLTFEHVRKGFTRNRKGPAEYGPAGRRNGQGGG